MITRTRQSCRKNCSIRSRALLIWCVCDGNVSCSQCEKRIFPSELCKTCGEYKKMVFDICERDERVL